jgi:hypothetical protein
MSALGIVVERVVEWYEAEDPLGTRPEADPFQTTPGLLHLLSDLEQKQPPNAYNAAILDEANALRQARKTKKTGVSAAGSAGSAQTGGTPDPGSAQSANPVGTLFHGYTQNPIDSMPENGEAFHYQTAIDTPAAGTNDQLVLEVQIPNGWVAVVKAVANVYTNNSLLEGSGDLTWRIDVDGRFQPGFEAITTQLGTVNTPRDVIGAILARGGQKLRYTVSVAATAAIPTGASAKIICCFDGYFVPEL